MIEIKKGLSGIVCRDKGFTLIELMVVVVIMGILSATIIPRFGAQIEKAKERRAMVDLSSIKMVIDLYYLENDNFPGEDDLAKVLLDNGIDWEQAKDPWGEDYVYVLIGSEYEIRSSEYGSQPTKCVIATDSREPMVKEPNG